MRLAASSGANPFACIAACIDSLWGPAHGGANEAVLDMLLEIGDVRNVPKFVSGIIYRALGIPRNMFTVMFAVARTVGWVAHWMEMMDDPNNRIGRPTPDLPQTGPTRLSADLQALNKTLASVRRAYSAPLSPACARPPRDPHPDRGGR